MIILKKTLVLEANATGSYLAKNEQNSFQITKNNDELKTQ